MGLRVKHVINFHKALCAPVVVALMLAYDFYGVAAWVYLALHGTYAVMWLVKDRVYPDKQWEQPIPVGPAAMLFAGVGMYWLAPFLLISRRVEPHPALIAGAMSVAMMGMFLHYTSDAQKYFTLEHRSGLITDGFFARSRNVNYLGETLIYVGFGMLSMHWIPFVVLAVFVAALFVPNMRKKDRSLSRYPQFAGYARSSGLFLPKLFRPAPAPAPADAVAERSVEPS